MYNTTVMFYSIDLIIKFEYTLTIFPGAKVLFIHESIIIKISQFTKNEVEFF